MLPLFPVMATPVAGPVLVVFALVAVSLAAQTPPAADNLPDPKLSEVWTPVPPVISAPAGGIPSDAIVLFDGRNLDAWESAKAPGQPAPWKLEDGIMICSPKTGYIRTKASFGDIQLHLEFRTPAVVVGDGQGRGNSGVFFMGLYELQILDSYNNPTYVNGQAASIYKQHAPLVNASRPPGEWQTYDAVWIAPRFSTDGKLVTPARVTVFHNGVIVQHDVVLPGRTDWHGTLPYVAHASKLPLQLQDHGNLTAFRNIWVREITLP